MSSKRTRERKALGEALQGLPDDTRAISPRPFAITGIQDGGVSVTLVPPVYLTQSGKEIERGKFSFLTRLFRRGVTVPTPAHKTSVALSQFRATRRRLSFYRNNG